MDRFTKIFILIFLLLVIIPIYNGNITNANTVNAKNYTDNGIFFEYPQNWQQLNQIESPNALTAFGDPQSANQLTGNINTLVIIQKASLPSGSTLKQVYDSNYAEIEAHDSSFKTISESLKRVDGTVAHVNTHTVNVNGVLKQEKAVWLEKNGNIYVILCGALPDTFDAQQTNFDMIINSFQVQ